jgi:uncharacterized protein
MGILSLLLGASIAATPLPTSFAPPAPLVSIQQRNPALWVVNDDDTVIYLFGTFHALDAESVWFTHAVRTAFFASEKLVLETLVPRPLGTARPFPARAIPPGAIGFASPAIPGIDHSPSFKASTKQAMDAGRSRGLSADYGADAVLRDTADMYGKPVTALETFQAQIEMFNSLPRAEQPLPSPNDPQAMQALGQMMASLQSAWSRGDVDTFGTLLTQMRTQSPQLYRTMFVERNVKWAAWIAERLNTPGTVFVAVGTGHLSGPDSVQHQLAMLGVKSARVN